MPLTSAAPRSPRRLILSSRTPPPTRNLPGPPPPFVVSRLFDRILLFARRKLARHRKRRMVLEDAVRACDGASPVAFGAGMATYLAILVTTLALHYRDAETVRHQKQFLAWRFAVQGLRRSCDFFFLMFWLNKAGRPRARGRPGQLERAKVYALAFGRYFTVATTLFFYAWVLEVQHHPPANMDTWASMVAKCVQPFFVLAQVQFMLSPRNLSGVSANTRCLLYVITLSVLIDAINDFVWVFAATNDFTFSFVFCLADRGTKGMSAPFLAINTLSVGFTLEFICAALGQCHAVYYEVDYDEVIVTWDSDFKSTGSRRGSGPRAPLASAHASTASAPPLEEGILGDDKDESLPAAGEGEDENLQTSVSVDDAEILSQDVWTGALVLCMSYGCAIVYVFGALYKVKTSWLFVVPPALVLLGILFSFTAPSFRNVPSSAWSRIAFYFFGSLGFYVVILKHVEHLRYKVAFHIMGLGATCALFTLLSFAWGHRMLPRAAPHTLVLVLSVALLWGSTFLDKVLTLEHDVINDSEDAGCKLPYGPFKTKDEEFNKLTRATIYLFVYFSLFCLRVITAVEGSGGVTSRHRAVSL